MYSPLALLRKITCQLHLLQTLNSLLLYFNDEFINITTSHDIGLVKLLLEFRFCHTWLFQMNQIVHHWKSCVCLLTGTTNLAWNSSHYIVNSLLKSTSIITGDSIIKALISPKAFWAEYLFKHIVIELIMKISWYRDFF